jgi:predicted amidophosphoribosyltransferase
MNDTTDNLQESPAGNSAEQPDLICPECGASIEIDDVICPHCGISLAGG